MTRTFLKGLALAALVGLSALSLPATAEAGRGWGGHGWGGHGYYGGRGWGGPGYWGAGLIGLGVGAAIGSALAAPVYVDPYVDAPPPPPALMRRLPPDMGRRPGRLNGTIIAPSATGASTPAPAISWAMTASRISANRALRETH